MRAGALKACIVGHKEMTDDDRIRLVVASQGDPDIDPGIPLLVRECMRLCGFATMAEIDDGGRVVDHVEEADEANRRGPYLIAETTGDSLARILASPHEIALWERRLARRPFLLEVMADQLSKIGFLLDSFFQGDKSDVAYWFGWKHDVPKPQPHANGVDDPDMEADRAANLAMMKH